MSAPVGGQGHTRQFVIAAFLAGALVGAGLAVAYAQPSPPPANADQALAELKARFRRPATVPFPASNPYSKDKRDLGEVLFHDPRLSADSSISCATCHDRAKGLADGRERGIGVPRRTLARHTPTLWNLAWAPKLFWDGRAHSLEDQVAGPVEARDEMALPVDALVKRLQDDAFYRDAFAKAFPADPRVTFDNLTKAIATFERTLVSPMTRFDRWVEGDAHALTPKEIAGFRLFAGKAQCMNCHSSWTFTDYSFQDIGMPGDDRGRGAVLRLSQVDHAFKTPGLRELARSGPYMHDGSLKTLDQVIDHYERGIVQRPTLSVDLPRDLALSTDERAALIAFLGTLSSTEEPEPLAAIVPAPSGPAAPAIRASTVTQDNKQFMPEHISLAKGQRLWILNNDIRTHNVRVFDPKLQFDSGAQEPGETVELSFPKAGSYLVFCGIHPKMELYVDVAAAKTK